ncbi:hypothetical protein IFM89_029638 [Coptis chinensis]|uniref:Vesicle transport protein n=1 Tax=Coptis chinensis TaxID=261450 RepID=A0A835IG58_9MAGN|nr:hypothetical protein IFM89_029638 [Coptis chinensis]
MESPKRIYCSMKQMNCAHSPHCRQAHLLFSFFCIYVHTIALVFVYQALFLEQRIYAFGASMVVGLIFMLLSSIVLARPLKFAILFTLGNVLAVGSTAFLIGPGKQMRMMLDSARVYASSIYIGSVLLALICALLIHNKLLTLLAIIIEIGALVWYSLSYIPFARRMVSELFVRVCDTEM